MLQTFIMAVAGIIFLLLALLMAASFGRDGGVVEGRTGKPLMEAISAEETKSLAFSFAVGAACTVLAVALLLFAR